MRKSYCLDSLIVRKMSRSERCVRWELDPVNDDSALIITSEHFAPSWPSQNALTIEQYLLLCCYVVSFGLVKVQNVPKSMAYGFRYHSLRRWTGFYNTLLFQAPQAGFW